jgi:hypothetical protein
VKKALQPLEANGRKLNEDTKQEKRADAIEKTDLNMVCL